MDKSGVTAPNLTHAPHDSNSQLRQSCNRANFQLLRRCLIIWNICEHWTCLLQARYFQIYFSFLRFKCCVTQHLPHNLCGKWWLVQLNKQHNYYSDECRAMIISNLCFDLELHILATWICGDWDKYLLTWVQELFAGNVSCNASLLWHAVILVINDAGAWLLPMVKFPFLQPSALCHHLFVPGISIPSFNVQEVVPRRKRSSTRLHYSQVAKDSSGSQSTSGVDSDRETECGPDGKITMLGLDSAPPAEKDFNCAGVPEDCRCSLVCTALSLF